jgi:glycosyltransferase involved in cell wall biosynthesis
MILYIGHYLSENIVQERGLPHRNAAGSNRILRLAHSISVNNREIEILSPGNSLRSKPVSKEACEWSYEEIGKIKVSYAKTTTIPIINLFVSTFSIISKIKDYSKNRKLSTVIIYNFSIEQLIITIYTKLFTSVKIINNVEDVSVPRLTDWSRKTESRAIQQLIFFFCMKLIARMADGFIIPTQQFAAYLPVKNKLVAVITGCCKVESQMSFECRRPLNILYSGKIEFEHGIHILIDAVKKIDDQLAKKIIVNICGNGEKIQWLMDELQNLNLDFVFYWNFLSDLDYKALLEKSDICLVLQNPNGRYQNLKTPSKFFEYYANGKCVISTNVGDYQNLPKDSFKIVDLYTSDNLYQLIKDSINNIEQLAKIKASAYHFAKDNFDYRNAGNNLINSLKI